MIFFYFSLYLALKNKKVVLKFTNLTPQLKDLEKTPFIHNSRITLSSRDLDDIYLGDKALCILLSNLELLKDSPKLKDVSIEKVAINKDSKDPWNKILFKDGKDPTGYFKGVRTDDFNLEETMLFHSLDIDDSTRKSNLINIKKLLYYISILKKKPFYKILQDDCNLDMIDKVIFKNLYDFKKKDDIQVCLCKDEECTICDGVYDTKRSKL